MDDQIQELKQQIEEKKLINLFPIKEISENTEKAFEKLLLQIRDLEEENLRISKMNEIYEFEIENLQKAQISSNKANVKPKANMNLMFDDYLNIKCISTQTINNNDFNKAEDWIHINIVLANALEDMLTNTD